MFSSKHRPGDFRSNATIAVALASVLFMNCYCSKTSTTPTPQPPPPQTGPTANYWITTGNRSLELQQQTAVTFSSQFDLRTTIDVDSTQQYQSVDGFGYTLTGGSAELINQLPAANKAALLQELFGNGASSIGISYLRVSLGASDLSSSVFSYDDMPAGQTDVNLDHFSLSKDTTDLIPVLKDILTINPNITILASPWSPPTWMKDNNNSIGGSLLTQYYSVYAQYFVKYIQAMKAKGITISAITIQNEPHHGGNNPSMVMNASEQANFIKDHLGPAFRNAGINTKIIIWDHNCDEPQYSITVLNDPLAKQYIDGSAFHLYNGSIAALTQVYNAHPDKNLYFTEQWTGANGSFDGDLRWHIKNVIIGSMRNRSKNALEWNLASDPNYNPHTPGGCTECKGALTINGASVSRNVSYYIVAHASKFIPKGSVRIASSETNELSTAAFVTPAGKKVLLVLNDSNGIITFNIKYKGQCITSNLQGGAVATYVW